MLTGGNLLVAALSSPLAAMVAAYGLVRLAELMPGGSRRAGLLLVALFAAAPMGVVLSMAYTEALFCALAAWALVGRCAGNGCSRDSARPRPGWSGRRAAR